MFSYPFHRGFGFRLISGFLTLLLLISLVDSAHAEIVRKYDKSLGCQKYQVINEEEDIPSHQKIYNQSKHYGLAVHKLKVNFEREQVSAVITQKIIMGFNKPLLAKPQKVVISRYHNRFEEFVDLHNRDLTLLRSICLRDGAQGHREVVDFEIK